MPPTGSIHHKSTYVMGVDLARMGEDSSAFIVIEQPFTEEDLYVSYVEEQKKKELTDACGRIMFLHNKFNFKKIYIDCTGLGAGPVDFLSQSNRIGRGIIEGVRFSSTGDNNKSDMYSNLSILLKSGRLSLPMNMKLINELIDLRYELSDNGRVKIHHANNARAHDDFADALALAALYWKGDRKVQGGFYIA